MRDFFENINFTFGTKDGDIKPSKIVVSEDDLLSKKLENNVYVFDAPEHSKSSFYLIDAALTGEEQFELRRYIWNENKYDLFFISDRNKRQIISLYYAKTNPREPEIKIATFNGRDDKKVENIRKWNFESGAFWLAYFDFLGKIKGSKRVDVKLVEQLKQLKELLSRELCKLLRNPDEIVQALIDRTLFIKFLEDNHIINSFFYKYYFSKKYPNEEVNYKILLEKRDVKSINLLFDRLNRLFNNVLFKDPFIEDKYISDTVMNLIHQSIQQYDWKTGQMSLFDFRFDVIPIEFISHIYEVFLEKSQLDEGIYYTPDKLVHLIIDDTILGKGTVLDPSCGSGMFLVLAFRKLLKFSPVKSKKVNDIINYRNKLAKDYIFGIEKSYTAWRLTVFSLYLEILKDISANEIKLYIQQKIENNPESSIFIDFSNNIVNCNALETEPSKAPHYNKAFDYIVGNPPFFQVTSDNKEIQFINEHEIKTDGNIIKAKDIIGYNQISQAFMFKLKDWAHEGTRFGFVQNSSNFYNENSTEFQRFFFGQYQVENFYELSRVKEILFRKAKENVVVTIFNNKPVGSNIVKYYPIYEILFSKVFELIVVQEDKKIDIPQKDILNQKIILRDYLIGNEYDLKLIELLSANRLLNDFLQTENLSSFRGMERATNKEVCKYFNISIDKFNALKNEEKTSLQEKFATERYLSIKKTDYYNTPYIYNQSKIRNFIIDDFDGYINSSDVNSSNFRRHKSPELFKGQKILFNRFGKKIEAAYIDYDCFFSTYLYVIKLQKGYLYELFTAILNSDLINFYLLLKYRKRIDNNYSNLDTKAIKNIPIPKYFDEEIVSKISTLSNKLTEGKLKYEGESKEKLNELIYDLYDLDYLERQRIKDFFAIEKGVNDFEIYKNTLLQTLKIYFKPTIEIFDGKDFGVEMVIVAIYINDAHKTMPNAEKAFKYILNKVIQENNDGLTLLKEKIVGKDCIYLIKDKQYQNWTETKAFEDGKDILKLAK